MDGMTAQTVATATGWVPQQDFATRLLLARRHLGLTVREAAMRCGIHYATWSTWERGSRPQDMASAVQAVADGLGADRDWLMWGTASSIGASADSTWSQYLPVVTKRVSEVTDSHKPSARLNAA